MKSRRIIAPLLALAVLSCSGDKAPTGPFNPGSGNNGTTGTGTTTTDQISVGDNFFSPTSTTVSVTTPVTWTWIGMGTVKHNVTFDAGGPNSSDLQPPATFSRSFSAPGSYTYHCTIHGVGMSGTIVVQ